MASIHEELQDLFYEDLMLSGNETVKNRIEIKQQALQKWGVNIIPEGLHHIRWMLQNINTNAKGDIGESFIEFDWELGDDPYFVKLMSGQLTEEEQQAHLKISIGWDTPSLSTIGRLLSNWMSLLVPIIDDIGISAGKAISSCFWSNDYQMATLAAELSNYENFRHFVDINNIKSRLKIARQKALRLQICHLLYSSGSREELKAEITPNIIPNKDLVDKTLSDSKGRINIWVTIEQLVIWDIATDGVGPRKRWPNWWV